MIRFATILCAATLAYSGEAIRPWSADPGRNPAITATDLPDHIGSDNLLWHVGLGKGSFFNVITIVGQRAYCGMNVKALPGKAIKTNDPAALLCFDISTGATIWSVTLPGGDGYGLTAVPIVTADAIYVFAQPNMIKLDLDGKILWSQSAQRDYYLELSGHGAHGTGLIIGDFWYQPTGFSLGTDCDAWIETARDLPWHPNLIVRNTQTGEQVAEDAVVLGEHQHGSWSSLSTGVVGGRQLVFWGDPTGILHAFVAPSSFPAGRVSTLERAWWCDANPASYRIQDGVRQPYTFYLAGKYGPSGIGPCEILACPVFVDGKVYTTITRDKEYGDKQGDRRLGKGALTCIDASGSGDVTATHKRWTNTDVQRTFCPPAVLPDRIVLATLAGELHGLDPATGAQQWKADVDSCMWNYFPIVADGKAYVTNENKDLFIIDVRDGRQLSHITLDAANNPSVGVAEGMVIVGTQRSIAAYGGPALMRGRKPAPAPESPQWVAGPDEPKRKH